MEQPERRHGPRRAAHGRRAEDEAADVGSNELMALIRALESRINDEREERRRLENQLDRVRTTVVRWSGAVVLVIFILSWIGPTRLANIVKAFSGSP